MFKVFDIEFVNVYSRSSLACNTLGRVFPVAIVCVHVNEHPLYYQTSKRVLPEALTSSSLVLYDQKKTHHGSLR